MRWVTTIVRVRVKNCYNCPKIEIAFVMFSSMLSGLIVHPDASLSCGQEARRSMVGKIECNRLKVSKIVLQYRTHGIRAGRLYVLCCRQVLVFYWGGGEGSPTLGLTLLTVPGGVWEGAGVWAK